MTFDLQTTQDGPTLLKQSGRLFFKTLSLSIILTALIIALQILILQIHRFVPVEYKEHTQQANMFLYIFMIPLFGMLICYIDAKHRQKALQAKDYLLQPIKRFLSLMACLISLAFIPVVLFFAGYLGSIVSVQLRLMLQAPFFIQVAVYVFIFLYLANKIYAPILTLTDKQGAMVSIETSAAASKGLFFRNVLYVGYVLSLLLLAVNVPYLIHYYFPGIAQQLTNDILIGISCALLLALIPWSLTLLICHKHDLMLRFEQQQHEHEKVKAAKFEAHQEKKQKNRKQANPQESHQSKPDDDVGF